jgi:hypothetical protein
MATRANGLGKRLCPEFILGYTDKQTVMLDFDNTPFKQVRSWASRVCKHFKLKDLLILKSSKNCYHVVFDRTIPWSVNISIVAWTCIETGHKGLNKWFLLQCIKQEPTLRVSWKGSKPPPRIAYRRGAQKEQIRSYLQHRRRVKNVVTRTRALHHPENIVASRAVSK